LIPTRRVHGAGAPPRAAPAPADRGTRRPTGQRPGTLPAAAPPHDNRAERRDDRPLSPAVWRGSSAMRTGRPCTSRQRDCRAPVARGPPAPVPAPPPLRTPGRGCPPPGKERPTCCPLAAVTTGPNDATRER